MDTILTCVYCGKAYPEGTPPHGAKILTNHIRVCEKHPLRKAEADIAKLREALSKLIGVERVQEITPTDVLAEGIPPETEQRNGLDLLYEFQDLWNSINAKRGFGWDKSPWVWVIEFKRFAK